MKEYGITSSSFFVPTYDVEATGWVNGWKTTIASTIRGTHEDARAHLDALIAGCGMRVESYKVVPG